MVIPGWVLYAAAALAAGGLIARLQGATMLAGVLVGAAWNFASLWCLARMLAAWLGPRASRRRALSWLLVKFPLLYLLGFVILRDRSVSIVGFGIGFTIVLAAALVALTVRTQRLLAPVKSHGR
jgi:hypothetical protein